MSDSKILHWPKLKNSWDIREAAGESQAKISVRNLQAAIKLGLDAWGRAGKVQPILISATVSLRKPFEYASVHDTVSSSTVHYGILSKAILEAVQGFNDKGRVPSKDGQPWTVKALLDHVAGHLTSYSLDGVPNFNPLVLEDHKPLLDLKLVNSLDLKVTLPKALLNSTMGLSLCGTIVFDILSLDPRGNPIQIVHKYAMSLVLHDIRVSTIIGVNSNERLAKQLVIANVEIDEWIIERDLYNELEELIFKTIKESSFQTLESLASHLSWRIVRYFIRPARLYENENFAVGFDDKNRPKPRLRISLEKPTAVTLADAPVVELLIDSMGEMYGYDSAIPPPFPLQGRLDEWIEKYDPKGLKNDPFLGPGSLK